MDLGGRESGKGSRGEEKAMVWRDWRERERKIEERKITIRGDVNVWHKGRGEEENETENKREYYREIKNEMMQRINEKSREEEKE